MQRTDFLKEDLPMVLAHYECCQSCLIKATEAFHRDDIETAEKRVEEFQRSLNELKRLQEKKRRHDEMERTVSRLLEKGVSVELIVKVGMKHG
ncbi:hypothetical protein NG54_03230 [Heyndrickxia ginsengihumi]|uniref:Uncharacterized protein n=1 Tax=Heyndrickxia ginsengihumi TaxID=363870 RepID=A0A0A6Y268_9BACI|nr:hypothetical protein [Heyndrickxia ginsengihumi]KHD86347.1 hypothetical protein NG54_03230 [Heyndrickxia ginsengihumi]